MNRQITEVWKPPIFVYYELNNFFQNHRVYLNSVDNNQLEGKSTEQSKCSPKISNKDLDKINNTIREPLQQNDVAIPCGLIAMTYFNGILKNYILNNFF